MAISTGRSGEPYSRTRMSERVHGSRLGGFRLFQGVFESVDHFRRDVGSVEPRIEIRFSYARG